MGILLPRFYSIYVALVFALIFLLLLPFQLLFSLHIRLHKVALWFNFLWAWLFMIFSFVPVIIKGRKNIPQGQYLFCSNHFSYLDIPAMGLLGGNFKFFGKASLKKIPIFGWMYNRLHVTVDRSSFKSRASALIQAREMLDHGFNMTFFPEGGVRVRQHPKLAPFKDGAFRLSVEKNLPIVPVILPNNHRVWPYDKRQLFYGGVCRVEVFPPIYPKGQTEEDILALRNEVQSFIQSKLDERFGVTSLIHQEEQ